MLSIIISSYQQPYYDQLVKNISETIGDGIVYEIIQMWNPNLMSITKAYNLGAEKSQYDNLLFIHEDLIFHTQTWGEKLITHLNKENVGIIGLAGSSYVPAAPSSWTVAEKYNFINILQGSKENNQSVHLKTTQQNMTEVFAVDGVFMAIKKKNYLDIKFNEDLLGFHGYDLDFSLRCSKKFQNYIIDDILIEHFSKGNQTKEWFDTNIKIKQNLKFNFNKKNDSETEKNNFLGFLYKYFEYYLINKENILFTLKFYPLNRINFKDHIIIAKKYYSYIKYASEINKKLKSTK